MKFDFHPEIKIEPENKFHFGPEISISAGKQISGPEKKFIFRPDFASK